MDKNTPSKKSRPLKYLIVGLTITAFNFGAYTLVARVIINNNDLLWVSNLIATSFAIIVAFILHSNITWKERNPGKRGVIRFFIWNIAIAIAISPALTFLFGLLDPLYQLAFSITSALNLPFDYDFVESTGVFVLVGAVTMVLNYFFYDKFVFGKEKSIPNHKKPDSDSNPATNMIK